MKWKVSSPAASILQCQYVLAILGLLSLTLLGGCGDDGGSTEKPTESICGGDLDCPVGQFCIGGVCTEEGDECFSNPDCPAGEVCRGGYCMLFVPDCTDDSGCGEGEICQEQECVLGCREDDQCDSGLVCGEDNTCVEPPPECPPTCPAHQACNSRTGECEPDGTCTTDGNCEGDLVCNEGVCGERIESCTTNEDCDEGKYCNRSINLCEEGCRLSNECTSLDEVCVDGQCTTDWPACEPDADEDNDTSEEALTISPGMRADLTLCNDEDWYSFFGLLGDDVSIALDFVHDEGDLTLTLYREDLSIAQVSGTNTDDESLMRTLDADGVYYILVSGSGRGVFTSYSLNFVRTRVCNEDDNEDNDSFAEAAALEPGMYSSRTVCGDDADWYAVELFADEVVDVSLDFLNSEGDLDLELYDAAETLIEASATDNDGESLSYTASGRETVYVHVPGGTDLEARYDLDIAVTPPACTDDDAEDNDDSDSATALALNTDTPGTICSEDEDWYSFFVTADVSVTIDLTFTHADGNLDMELVSPDGTTVAATGDSTDDNEQISFDTDLPGMWFVRVYGEGRTQNTYSLNASSTLTVTCPDDDSFEENDDAGTAAALAEGVTANLAICEPADEDWYSFTLGADQSVEAFVLAAAGQGDLDIALFAPGDDTSPFFERTGAGEVKRVRAQQGSAAGEWKLRVSASSGDDIQYSLRLFLYDGPLPLDCEFDDELEDDDIPADASNLSLGQTRTAIACPGDDGDFHRVRVDGGTLMNVRVDFLHAEGDIDVTLHTATPFEVVGNSASTTDNEFLAFVPEGAGEQTLFVEVALAGGEGAVYDLTVSTIDTADTESLNCTVDDLFESNDTITEAAMIEQGATTAIRCGTDEDWFTFDTGNGDDIRVSLFHDGGNDDLELELYNPSESLVASAPGAAAPVRVAETTTTSAGTWAVRVFGPGDVDLPYTIHVQVLEGQRGFCGTPDDLEPNTSATDATVIDADGTYLDLGLCLDDEDWFAVELPAGMRAVVDASFDGTEGDIDLEAFDVEGVGRAASRSNTDSERVVVPGADVDTTGYVRVFRADRTSDDVRYDLAFTYEVDAGVCSPDDQEPNDTLATAVPITSSVPDLSICLDDEDWFRSDASLAVDWTVTITFDGSEADLDLEVYTSLDPVNPFRTSAGTGDSESVTLFLPLDILHVRVFSFDGGTTDYDLTLSTFP